MLTRGLTETSGGDRMTQPPQGPWRPMGPLPPPQARPMPPPPAYGQPYPPQQYNVHSGPPPGMPPRPPYPPQGGYPQQQGMPPRQYPPRGPYPQSTMPPWLQPAYQHRLAPRKSSNTGALLATILVIVLI